MALERWALIASVVFTGLWSGLLAMLTLILHPMLAQMRGADFARFLRAFLPTARRAPFNYIEVLGMVAAPVLALVGLGLALGRQSAAVRRGAERTAHQAMHDELTGLPNRLLSATAPSARSGRRTATAFRRP